MTYTADQIETAWAKYKKIRMLKTIKAGKATYTELIGNGIPRLEGCTRATTVSLSSVMSFPKFLKTEEK